MKHISLLLIASTLMSLSASAHTEEAESHTVPPQAVTTNVNEADIDARRDAQLHPEYCDIGAAVAMNQKKPGQFYDPGTANPKDDYGTIARGTSYNLAPENK